MPQVTGTLDAAGDATVVTVPAGESIQVWGMQFYIPSSDLILRVFTGATEKFVAEGYSGSVVCSEPKCHLKEPLIQGAKGEDLILNLSDSLTVHYNIQYVTV